MLKYALLFRLLTIKLLAKGSLKLAYNIQLYKKINSKLPVDTFQTKKILNQL